MPLPTLRTGRLVLRPFVPDDLAVLTELFAEPSFWWYPSRAPWSREQSADWLDRQFALQADGELGVSAVVVAATGEVGGYAGLAVPTFLPEVLPAVEVGWRLGEAFRGQGFATEAGGAWISYGFTELGLEAILSIYEPENEPSGNVMRKLGLRPWLQTISPTYGTPLHVTRLSRRDWQRSAASDAGVRL